MTLLRTLGVLLFGATVLSCSGGDGSRARLLAVDSALAAGEALYWASDLEGARAIWSAGLEQARRSGDGPSGARLLTWLGLAAWRLGKYTEAREQGEAALAAKRALGMHSELWLSHNALAVLALSEDRLFDAQRHARDAVAAARDALDPTAMSRASSNLALSNLYLGDFEEARAGFRTVREAARAVRDVRVEANALANLALTEMSTGDVRAAVALLDSARTLYRAIDYAPGEQNALGQLAIAYEVLGEYTDALATLDGALALAREHDLPEQEMEILRLLGSLHERLGDVPRALRYLEQAAAIGRSVGLPGELGNVLRTEAKGRLALGMIPLARALADSARAAHRAIGAVFDEFDDVLVQAEIEQAANRPAPVLSKLREARELADILQSPAAHTALQLAAARLADRSGDPRAVVDALRVRVDALTDIDFGIQSEGNALLARAYAKLGALDSAAAAGYRAVRALERARSGLPAPLSTQYAGSRADVYADLVLALLRLGREEDAFAVADGARSRALLEQIATAREGIGESVAGRALLEAEELLRRIDQLVQQLRSIERTPPDERGAAFDPTTTQLRHRIGRARSDYEALVLRRIATVPRESRLLGLVATRLADVQQVLGEDEVLLEYMLAGDAALLFIVSRSGLDFVPLPNAVALPPRVRVMRDLWGQPGPNWRAGLPLAQALHEVLLEPALRTGLIRPGSTLLIVPHGVLAQVPFAALLSTESGRFVAEDHVIVMLPSAAALPALRARAEPSPGMRGALFAPATRQLPATLAELDAIRAYVPADAFRGRAAHEPALRRELGRAAFVHIASHGVLNATNPLFSRVELAGPRGKGAADDGRLEVHEVMGLRLSSALVFLSGCETSAAREWSQDPVRGSAYTTLAQAFLFAGARDVVATLWRVNDRGAAKLAARFYHHLQDSPTAAALARAQRDLIRDPLYENPYYWAGYALHGSGSTTPLAQNGRSHPLTEE